MGLMGIKKTHFC